MYVYIKVDENGFVMNYQNTESDGFTRVYLLDSWIVQFMQFPTKFRYGKPNDTATEQLLNPGNLPNLSLKDLNDKYEAVLNTNKQVTQSTTSIAKMQTENAGGLAQVQQAVTVLAMQNAMSSATSETKQTANTDIVADTDTDTKEEA